MSGDNTPADTGTGYGVLVVFPGGSSSLPLAAMSFPNLKFEIMKKRQVQTGSEYYLQILDAFRLQYKSVSEIERLHVIRENDQDTIIGGEWKDENGAFNFTGGTIFDAEIIVEFV